jgi:hypothetical protein
MVSLSHLRCLIALLGSAALVALACGDTSGDGGSEGDGQDTDTGPPPCGVVRLADVAGGRGGFAMDGEAWIDESGRSVSGAGDVNGDGLADLVVGAHFASSNMWNMAGRTYVVFGKTDTDEVALTDVVSGTGGFALDGEHEAHHSGRSVSGAGDVNGDGFADVVVLAPDAYDGRTYVVFGRTDTTLVELWHLTREDGGFAVGGSESSAIESVSGVGDVNDDGLADIVVGGCGESTYVVFGKADTERVALAGVEGGVGGFAMEAEAGGDEVGRSVSGAGDVNGDGVPDVIVGAPGADPNGAGSGRAYVVFGKADTDAVALSDVAQGLGGFALDGEVEGDHSGSSVGGAGDVNGDGLADVVVGAPGADPNGANSGRAYVVFGKADAGRVSLADVAAGVGGFVVDGEAEKDGPGGVVTGAGDLNGDGLADVFLGAMEADPNGESSGRAYVVYGKANTDEVSLADVAQGIGGFVLDGETAQDGAGVSVSAAGDVNGDGIPDLVLGALGAPGGAAAGRTYVVFGGDFSCE